MLKGILTIWAIFLLSSHVKAQNANLEIYGNVLNDSLVRCSVFELIEHKPVLIGQVVLDRNYYYTNLDYNKLYVLIFEGTNITKWMYVAPKTRKVLQINVDFKETEKKHCFVQYDLENKEYNVHEVTDVELQGDKASLGREFYLVKD